MQELTVKSMWSSMVLIAGDETKEHMNTNRKYLRPSEVEEIYGIKQGTLTKQRSQGYGLPYVVIGRKPKKRKGIHRKNLNKRSTFKKYNRQGR